MNEYKVIYSDAAQKSLKKISRYDQGKIRYEIEKLSKNPRKMHVIKLKGDREIPLYRSRQGNYRIIFEIHDNVFLIQIIAIAKRDESTYKSS